MNEHNSYKRHNCDLVLGTETKILWFQLTLSLELQLKKLLAGNNRHKACLAYYLDT